MNTLTITTVGLALLGSGTLFSVPQDPQPKTSKDTLVLAAGEHALADVIDRSARFLGRNYLYQADEVRMPGSGVSLQTPLTLTRESCEEVLENFLYARGLAIVATHSDEGIWEVIQMQGVRRGEISAHPVAMTMKQVLENRHRKRCVKTVVQVANLNASNLVTILRPFVGGAGPAPIQFGSVNPTSLMIQGFADQVAAVIDQIAEIDAGAGEKPPAEAVPVPIVRKQLATICARLDALDKRLERLEARLK